MHWVRPGCVGASEIVFGINPAAGHRRHDCHANCEAIRERAELLKAFSDFKCTRGERDPPLERPSGVGVDTDVAEHEPVSYGRIGGVAQKRNWRA